MQRIPLTVLEVGEFPVVAFSAKAFVTFGARVIAVEPHAGHRLRTLGNVWPAFGAGKESVCLDIREGQQIAWLAALAERCDIVLDGLGITEADWAARAAIKHRMENGTRPQVLATVTPFGLVGGKSGWQSTSYVDYHAGGDAYMLPPGHSVDDRAPVVTGDLAGDGMAGWGMTGPVYAHYFGLRRAAGHGERFTHLDFSKQDLLINMNRVELSRFMNLGVIESRLTKAWEVGGIFYAQDRAMIFYLGEDHHWDKLFDLMGNPDWSTSEAFATRASRRQNAAILHEHLQVWCASFEAEELYHRCQQAGLPVGYMRRPEEVFRSEQARQRGFFQRARDETGAEQDIPWLPIPTRLDEPLHVPALGAYTASALAGDFGIVDWDAIPEPVSRAAKAGSHG